MGLRLLQITEFRLILCRNTLGGKLVHFRPKTKINENKQFRPKRKLAVKSRLVTFGAENKKETEFRSVFAISYWRFKCRLNSKTVNFRNLSGFLVLFDFLFSFFFANLLLRLPGYWPASFWAYTLRYLVVSCRAVYCPDLTPDIIV